MSRRGRWGACWVAVAAVAVGVRLWNALTGARMWGYDAWGHVAYVLYLDLYRALPWADQGWSYFHPPLHYAIGWVLAQAGSGEVLMRGLALWNSAASLATAALAAVLARRLAPDRPGLALLAFASVALLPVHLFMSAMPGNELTETLWAAATLVVFVWNEGRERPGVAGAALVGFLAGLALLTKFSGLLPLLVVLACLATRPLARGEWHAPLSRVALRAALTAGVAVAVCAPYYLRNWREFGTPFQLSRDFALVQSVEGGQPPGIRTGRHYLRFPLETFRDPNPLAPHLVRAVWPNVYLNVWADLYRESDVARALEAERERRASTRWMALLGLLPTAVFAWGALLAAADVWRGRRRALCVPLLVQTLASLGAFAVFAWQVPIWSALKASYLLGLSLPFGVFLARACESLGSLGARSALAGALACVFGAAAWVGVDGAVLPRRADAPATGAVHYYFGELDEARHIYERLATGAAYPVPWLESWAAVELAAGESESARGLQGRAVALARRAGRDDARRVGRWALAIALAGDPRGSLEIFDEALDLGEAPEVLANRGSVRAVLGDAAGAEADLAVALAEEPGLVPAWSTLARVRAGRGDAEGAARATARGLEAACRAPRGYPYGLGTGEVLEWGVARRGLLLLDEQGLRLAPPSAFRRRCG